MRRRPQDWQFGPLRHFCEETREWYARHEPTVDRWLSEMEAQDDPWWPSAAHAAFCLVSSVENLGDRPDWALFDPADFLFTDLSEGGTVSFFGSVPMFFEHLVAALERFAADGLIEADHFEHVCEQVLAARSDFIEYYELADADRCREIRARYRARPLPAIEPRAPAPPRRPKKIRKVGRIRHPRRRRRSSSR